MILHLVLKFVGAVMAVGVIAAGGYYLVKEQGIRSLAKSFEEHLDSGDYLAALGAAENLRVKGGATPELEGKITEAARLLVAEDVFAKAKQASLEKRYADASALLRGSDAVSDPAFKYFEEAKKLYEEAEALAAGAAHRTNVALSALEEKAATEKTRREGLELSKAKLEGTLLEKESKIKTVEAEAKETAVRLEQSKRDTDAKQAALLAEQARAKLLSEQVEKESRQKFINELRVYRDMAEKGKTQLENSIAEINGKRDVTALIYVSQGKILFEEAKNKAADLRASRTPSAYTGRVDELVNSLGQFLEASKQLRNAVVYIEEQGSADFTNSLSKAKSALANAVSHLASVSDLIASNQ